MGNYRMAKKAKVNLSHEPRFLDFYSQHFALCYADRVPNIDIFAKEGEKVKSFNIEHLLQKYDIELVNISRVLFPRMKWSDRKVD